MVNSNQKGNARKHGKEMKSTGMNNILRFSIILMLITIAGCSEPVSDSTKYLVSKYMADFKSAETILDKKEAAERVAMFHWKEKDRIKWQNRADKLMNDWRSQNCVTGVKSNEEKALLSKISSTRITFNDYNSIAINYKKLFELCFEESYGESYSEFNALSEFASKTNSICGEVVHTYSGEDVARKIRSVYKELSTMDEVTSRVLGNEAVKGYGKCMCVMHDYFKVRDNISIGFCIGPNYFTCSHPQMSGAFCGESGNRDEMAKIIGDYKYRTPRGISSYGSYLSPGSTAADLLEWGKSQTESLVRSYCSGNPDC
jgi:hypothetical protein